MLNEPDPSFDPQPTRRLLWPATAALLAVNAAVWLVQLCLYYRPVFPINGYFALSVEGLRHGYIWQLLTYQFMHAVPTPWHLLLNSWAIFVFGRIVEVTMGRRRMLGLYFLSGTMGGLLQILGMAVFPTMFGTGDAVGASAGAFGLVAAFAVLYPTERLYVLLLFILPLRMRATTLLKVFIAFTVFGILEPLFENQLPLWLISNEWFQGLFGSVAHAAHLGGIFTGAYLARQWARRRVHRRRKIEPEAKTSLKITAAPD